MNLDDLIDRLDHLEENDRSRELAEMWAGIAKITSANYDAASKYTNGVIVGGYAIFFTL